jgi:phage terminase large subunit-like protein
VGFVPQFDGHVCSLGYDIVDWLEEYACHGPGDVQGEPLDFALDQEVADHIIECYRLDPVTGRRVYDEVVFSRPKGRAKSEVAGFIVVAEAFASVRFDGWNADGLPVGKPVTSPLIKCLATEESQAGNTFENVAYIVSDWGADVHPEIYGGASGVRQYQSASAIYLPHGGEIRACTSGAASKDGGKETHVVADETHLYVLPALKSMYATIARNLGKRKIAQPWLHQTSTAYRPGEMSVFEDTLTKWRKGELRETIYVNHREAQGKIDLDDEARTMRQLEYVYGDSAAWQDLTRKYAERNDTRIYEDEEQFIRYALNRPLSGKDVWIAKDIVERQARAETVEPGEPIALGFDGSLNDDATALVGCRMSDGFLFPIRIWASPGGTAAQWWEVPRLEVLAEVRATFERYTVSRLYADPHEWRSDIEALAEELGEDTVIPWATSNYTAMSNALDRLRTDLIQGGEPVDGKPVGRAWHSGDPLMMEHFNNAYVARRGRLRLVRKEHDRSPRKIDSLVAATLAYEARADAIAAGWGARSKLTRVKGRASAY